ncbi:MAG: hypothetical protein WDL87_06880 [Candidatus Omnitrophota bacterium]|jgi:hypothetical protein
MDKKAGMLVGIALAIFFLAIVAINMVIKQFETEPKVTVQQLPIKTQTLRQENKIVPARQGKKLLLEDKKPELEAPIAPGEQLLQ